jgi:hypothetical protein
MSSKLSIEVLQMILENVDKAGLATVCQVNRICCTCAQDILYRNIDIQSTNALKVIRTLAQSTHLSRRVRSFSATHIFKFNPRKGMVKALQNMSSLRSLTLQTTPDLYSWILDVDVYTFKLDSFSFQFNYDEPETLLEFLNSQPSLTHLEISTYYDNSIMVETTCLPNLTWVSAPFLWLRCLIPDRPVSEVNIDGQSVKHEDLNLFTLSATPILKLTLASCSLYPIPVKHLASVFPSLVHLCMYMRLDTFEEVRVSLFHFSNHLTE